LIHMKHTIAHSFFFKYIYHSLLGVLFVVLSLYDIAVFTIVLGIWRRWGLQRGDPFEFG
jgi:hypothetical protein